MAAEMLGPDATAALVGRAKRGERDAFAGLAREYLRAAYAVALAVVGRPADADADVPGPAACITSADCDVAGACPSDAPRGCDCLPIPTGGNACIPLCVSDSDCPSPPGMTLVCGPEGFCVPSGGGP
jgi:hypothetical protein